MNIAVTSIDGMNRAPRGRPVAWLRLVLWLPPVLLACSVLVRLATLEPAAAIHVRWAATTSTADREAREQAYLLTDPERLDGQTVAYVLLDTSRANIARLVRDPRAADTSGVDRGAFTPVGEAGRRTWLLYRLPVVRHPRVAQWLLVALALLSLPALVRIASRRAVAGGPRSVAGLAGIGAAGLVLIALSYLLTGPRLTADESFSLWAAQAFLRGERPYVDFFDAGAPLLWWLSAAGQWLSGGRVIGEVALALTCQTIGLLVTYGLARRASGSRLAASVLTATAAALVLSAQLYGYPKVFIYPVALWAIWRYVDRPDRRRALGLAAVTIVAFLLRHDHGFYVGLASATAIVGASWLEGLRVMVRRVVAFGAIAVLGVLPLLTVIGIREGITEYFAARLQLSAALGLGDARTAPRLAALWPMVGAAEPWPAPVSVQWADGMPDGRRQLLEGLFSLQPRRADGQYLLRDLDAANIRRMLREPAIRHIGGIEALTDAPARQNVFHRVRNWFARRSLAPLPQVLGTPASLTLLYSGAMVAPAVALVLLGAAAAWWPAAFGRLPLAAVLATVVLLAGAHYGLVRRPGQIVETATIDAVLSAWILGTLLVGVRTTGTRVARQAIRAAAAFLVAAMCLVGFDVAHADDLWQGSDLAHGVRAVRTRLGTLWRAHTAARPIDVFAPAGSADDRTVVRYLHECTAPSDRIWETTGNFAAAYYADRGVVQHLFWNDGFRRDRQRELLAWLHGQRVPVILIRSVASPEAVFSHYPLVQQYVATHYRDVTSAAARRPESTGGRSLWILADTRVPVLGTFAPLNLPCFVARP